MTLKDMVSLNLNMGLDYKFSFLLELIPPVFVVFMFVGDIDVSAVWLALSAAVMVIVGFSAGVELKNIFYSSMFSERAYQYMSLPASFDVMVKGKLIAALSRSMHMWMYVIMCLGFLITGLYQSGKVEGFSFLTDIGFALINMHSAWFDGIITTPSVIFIVVSSPITAIIEGFFICTLIQYGVIIRNLLGSRKESLQLTVGIILAAICVYAVTTILFLWLPGMLFENDFAIPQLIIAMILKIVCGFEVMRGSVRLLERKYSLN